MFKKITALSFLVLITQCAQDTKPVKKNVLDPYIHIKPLQAIIAGYLNGEISNMVETDLSQPGVSFWTNDPDQLFELVDTKTKQLQKYAFENWNQPRLRDVISPNCQFRAKLKNIGPAYVPSLAVIEYAITFYENNIEKNSIKFNTEPGYNTLYISFTQDSSHLILTIGNSIKIWDLNGNLKYSADICHARGERNFINSVACSPCGKYIAFSESGHVHILDAKTFKNIRSEFYINGLRRVKFCDQDANLELFYVYQDEQNRKIGARKVYAMPTELEYEESN